MSTTRGWGPSHQSTRRAGRNARAALSVVIAVALWFDLAPWYVIVAIALAVWLGVFGRRLWVGIRPRLLGAVAAEEDDPLGFVRRYEAKYGGGGVYLGVAENGDWRHARRERAVLVLGPPRSGKTSAVIIPALIAHPGAAVCTSTKADVATATRATRSG